MRVSPELEAKILAQSSPPKSSVMIADVVAPFPLYVSEKAFQAYVVRFAQGQGFRVFHTHDSRRSEGGYPDLTMVRRGRARGRGQVIYAELKSMKGKVTREQQWWIDDLLDAGCEVFVWRPDQWNEICATLGGEL